MLKFIKKYLDYRLRKFCVKQAVRSNCINNDAEMLYRFVKGGTTATAHP